MSPLYELIVNVISMICILLTLAVYLYVRQLRNTLGKCVTCKLFCLFFCYLQSVSTYSEEVRLLPTYFQDFFVFCGIANETWNGVISYHLWKVFRPLGSPESRHQFLMYNAFAWTSAATATGLSIIERYFYWSTTVAVLNLVMVALWAILVFFNVVMFFLTTINIWKVKKEIKRFSENEDTPMACLSFDTQTYLQFLRIFVMIGISWILRGVPYLMYFFNFYDFIVYCTNTLIQIFQLGFGIWVFVLLVVKRTTLQMLTDSIRERRNKRRIRAQRAKDLA
ncbi:probable G-protein coupled receptor Mth-like 7 [Drosophila biarmipes]|uniref:probable G-protein coupled receptor Mth-like 7 n=1 Tax=Drosophila biarmipes TaxID=125945 RepID=UPI0021CD151E|nr:probable G-protein coupled receptor Mth-like 7 [Drosophila biarmipes]